MCIACYIAVALHFLFLILNQQANRSKLSKRSNSNTIVTTPNTTYIAQFSLQKSGTLSCLNFCLCMWLLGICKMYFWTCYRQRPRCLTTCSLSSATLWKFDRWSYWLCCYFVAILWCSPLEVLSSYCSQDNNNFRS